MTIPRCAAGGSHEVFAPESEVENWSLVTVNALPTPSDASHKAHRALSESCSVGRLPGGSAGVLLLHPSIWHTIVPSPLSETHTLARQFPLTELRVFPKEGTGE